MESLSAEDCSIWKMTVLNKSKFFRTLPAIKNKKDTYITALEKSDSFASALEKQFSPNAIGDPTVDRKVKILN